MRYSKIGGKILWLLAAGNLLTYTRGKRQRKEILEEYDKVWLSIDRKKLFDALRLLRLGGHVNVIKRASDKWVAELTEKGRARGLFFSLDSLSIKKPKKWDGKWRVVVFDIPEGKRRLRDSLRMRLKTLGFYELQRSVFVFPYPCENEVTTLISAFGLEEEVRILEAAISYDRDLRKIFEV